MSNFLLGLACHTEEGNRAVDDLLQRGMILPEGMHSSPRQWLDFIDDQHQDQFGKSQKVLCPMLDPSTGYCRVHVFRNSVCSTYFCEKDQGSAGNVFWSQIQTLGTQLEMRLSQWALREIGFDLDGSLRALDELAPDIAQASTEHGWHPETLQRIWGQYWGREKELLQACAAAVVKHRDQLWSIAQQQAITESHLFDQALLQQVPQQQSELLDKDDDDWEPINLEALWQECVIAHDALWEQPLERFTLSPNVLFMPNKRQNTEEVYHQEKAYFIEYRFQNATRTLAFRLAISADQKHSLETFAGAARKLEEAGREQREFLLEMVHRKVLWSVADS